MVGICGGLWRAFGHHPAALNQSPVAVGDYSVTLALHKQALTFPSLSL